MNIKDFTCEQWMTQYERKARYNMTDTSFEALRLEEFLESDAFDGNLVLDYGEIDGAKEFKEQVEKLYSKPNRAITSVHGAVQGNEHVMMSLLESGDHVIAFTPGYQQFYDLPSSIGCLVSLLPYEEDNGWKLPLEKIEKAIGDKTKMIVLASPSNPTGASVSYEEWIALIDLCKDKGIYILCDEVYRGLDGKKVPSISDLYELGIVTGSLSKVYGLPGLRLGWIRANKKIIDLINVRRDYTMISTGPLIDHLGSVALKKKEGILARNRTLLKTNLAFLKGWLAENPHFSGQFFEEAPVAFLHYDFDIDSKTLSLALLKECGVFFVPGSCFGYEGYLRLGLGRDPISFQKGLTQCSQWIEARLKKI